MIAVGQRQLDESPTATGMSELATSLRDDPNYQRSLRECLDGAARRPYYRRMSLAFVFWLIMLLAILFGGYHSWGLWPLFGGNFLVWVLLALLGWKVFGPPIHG